MSKLARLLRRAEKIPGFAEIVADSLEAWIEDVERADGSFRRTHWGDEAEGAELADVPIVRPGEAVTSLGELAEIAYEGQKGGEWVIWVHPFEDPRPHLAYTATGGLVIVGGNYRVTERGIVG